MNVDGVVMEFPDDWIVERYDDWTYVRNQFNGAAGGCKAVDLVGKDRQGVLWFIEVKDYRYYRRTKVIDLADEIAVKVRDSMAGLVGAVARAEGDERKQAASLLNFKRIRVALQLEQPKRHSKLFPRAVDPLSVRQKLQSRIKPIDPHPVITSKENPYPGVEWTVT